MKPKVKLTTNTFWTVGYLKKIMEHLPDETKITNYGIINHGLCFELPADFEVETTVKRNEANHEQG